MVRVDNQTWMIWGGAFGAAIGGEGHACGCFAETVKFSGTPTGCGEQAVTDAAIAPTRSIKRKTRKGFGGT